MALTTQSLKAGLTRIAKTMEAAADELNTADGKLGDGDLGVTMVRGCRLVMEALPDLPEDVGLALMKCAQAFTKTSGSSYGTLLATGLMSAAKATRGRTEVPWSEIGILLGEALESMRLRGKASLGDKTVLDAMAAARSEIGALDDPVAIATAADRGAGHALEQFRVLPNKIGRARIFGDRSIGLDDPGMLAFKRLVEALLD